MADIGTAGYFRIGHVVLDIPPTDIATNRVINDDQVATLRTSTPMFIKSGQSRWDVTVRWKAVRTEDRGVYNYSQWDNLRRIVAIFKAAPFVEVENDFLRQHFTNIQQAYQTQRMAFALKQLRIDSNPDSINVIDVTLTMSLFNYAPYSKDFGYTNGKSDVSVDANVSTEFAAFISGWMAGNMDRHQADWSSPPIMDWRDQDDGVMTFKWRKYLYIPFRTPPAGGTAPSTGGFVSSTGGLAPAQPKPRTPQRVRNKGLSSEIKALIDRAATQHGLDPAIVEAQCLYESGGDPLAGLGRTDHGGLGLMQLVASTARQLGVTDPFDAEQNVNAACRYLRERLNLFKTYPLALAAYNTGDAYVRAYSKGQAIHTKGGGTINPDKIKTTDGLPPAGVPHGENAGKYVRTILKNANRSGDLAVAPFKSVDGNPPQTSTQATPLDIPDPKFLDAVNAAVQQLPRGEWWLDHYTELGAFFYENEEFTMASAEAEVDGDFDLYPNQVSVVMVNNLPMIPLSAMQYPTYQHVGPTDTIINIGMHSVGAESEILSEAEHQGVQALAAMTSQLEEQFHQLRTTFRAVSSIHRMQAVFMENKLLNLLGIQGTLVRGLNTETVPESSNLVQASLMASQYENIFEQTTPFRINGVANANRKPLKDLLTTGQLNNVSKAEQEAYAVVKNFGNSWRNRDVPFLLQEIFSITKEKINFLSECNVASAGLRPDQKANLLGYLDITSSSTLSEKVPVLGGVPISLTAAATGTVLYQKDIYPGLEARRQDLKNSGGDMTYADYLVFTNLPKIPDISTNNSIINTTETKLAAQKSDIVDQIYEHLFDFELLTNPAFSRQAQAITNSPFFKDRFNNKIDVKGPASQPGNEGHGCYKDLGLTNYAEDPAGYFIDYNQILRSDAYAVIADIMGKANQTANQTNATQKVQGGSPRQGFEFQANGQGLPGSANALQRMTHIPAYSMNTAYPTYKLMLLEEDNNGPFFAFDNFYSYASIIDIEVIKYRDKPDTAIIQISNLAHLLQHRMYDDTAAGKMERDADRFNVSPTGGLVQGGPGVQAGDVGTGGGESTTGITASKAANGEPYYSNLRKDLTEGRGDSSKRVPLKFFALQTGTKVQVRLGFSNNPDALYPVFTGTVTSIEGEDVLTLVCQSFMLELMNVPGTTVKANSRWGLNFASGGAAYGGWSLSSSGDTNNVMKSMLKSPAARHFGHWQINSLVDPKIKGFAWLPYIGEAMEGASSKTISALGSLLQTGYDRSGENILVNSATNIDTSKSPTDAGARKTIDHENPNWFIGTARYGIAKQSQRSIWDIITDIGRRYPHYNLMVRPYGFPYAADATLVYAHPTDWYYSRPPLFGEAEKEHPNNVTQGQAFKDWWNSAGKKKWDILWKEAHPSASHLLHITPGGIIPGVSIDEALDDAQGPMTDLANEGPEGFSDAIDYLHGILTGASTNQNIPFLYKLAAHIQNWGNLTQGFYLAVDGNFAALYREWTAYLQTTDPAANSSRLAPVRKYHLIDNNHIVHNSIKINDQIYNAVKIRDNTPYKFNQNIPDQHTRVLDVTDMIEDPDNNVLQGTGEPIAKAYAQSFLREEVGKMYQGELVLRGVPEIEPFDVILLQDMSTGTIGPIEVETVIHSFNLENGYITIVKPRLMVLANEDVSLGLIQNLSFAWANAQANYYDLKEIFNPLNINTTTAARGLTVGAGAGLVLAGASLAWAPPVGLALAGAGLLIYGIYVYSEARATDNFFMMMPLSRYGRPWLGGVQGFALSDFAYSLGQSFKWFDAEEISPTIESWNELIHWRGDYVLNP